MGNQVISLAPAGTSTTTTSSSLNTSSATAPTAATSSAAANAITQLTDEQKRIVFEFKQKLASLPADQQGAYIAANKGALLKKLNFHPNQLQLLRNNHIQLQLTRPTINVNQVNSNCFNSKIKNLLIFFCETTLYLILMKYEFVA